MSLPLQYTDLNEFLAKHIAKQGNSTHTRIPDKELGSYGGSFIIPNEELNTFHNLLYDQYQST